MDAYKLVSYAKNWTLVPPQVNYTMWSNQTNRYITEGLNSSGVATEKKEFLNASFLWRIWRGIKTSLR